MFEKNVFFIGIVQLLINYATLYLIDFIRDFIKLNYHFHKKITKKLYQ